MLSYIIYHSNFYDVYVQDQHDNRFVDVDTTNYSNFRLDNFFAKQTIFKRIHTNFFFNGYFYSIFLTFYDTVMFYKDYTVVHTLHVKNVPYVTFSEISLLYFFCYNKLNLPWNWLRVLP